MRLQTHEALALAGRSPPLSRPLPKPPRIRRSRCSRSQAGRSPHDCGVRSEAVQARGVDYSEATRYLAGLAGCVAGAVGGVEGPDSPTGVLALSSPASGVIVSG